METAEERKAAYVAKWFEDPEFREAINSLCALARSKAQEFDG